MTPEFPIVLDLEALNAATFGNADLQGEVLQLLLGQTSTLAERLEGAATAQVQAEVLHTYKGSARSLGAMRIAETCQQLEQRAASGERVSASALLSDIAEVERAVRAVLGQG
ncbi:Hpt domain-containing protein [Roseibium aestuarii]|uniref:Hpt domain-containing protein n=1 Tax=Roseibium aestuarii TaxID=2600299 RepID=A0ABW4JWW3_9HYPH|nr:Hpt domain-containing protein [Roseibium aestuarii]